MPLKPGKLGNVPSLYLLPGIVPLDIETSALKNLLLLLQPLLLHLLLFPYLPLLLCKADLSERDVPSNHTTPVIVEAHSLHDRGSVERS